MTPSAQFALALDRMDGVGRVTAGRLLDHFPTYEALRRYPREQVLARIKGVARAEDLVNRLFDAAVMQDLLDEASETLQALAEKRVQVLTSPDPEWPHALDVLQRSHRPFALYTYGQTVALQRPGVALLARPPLASDAFEQAQAVVRHLLPHQVVPVTGLAHGFDVVVLRISQDSGAATLMVASCGLARIAPTMRPVVSAAVHAGGLVVSAFAMDHGPFEHDDHDRAYLQASLARASVFVEPRPGTPEWGALMAVIEAGRPVFGIPAPDHPLPEAVHPLRTSVDFDWVLAAVQ